MHPGVLLWSETSYMLEKFVVPISGITVYAFLHSLGFFTMACHFLADSLASYFIMSLKWIMCTQRLSHLSISKLAVFPLFSIK